MSGPSQARFRLILRRLAGRVRDVDQMIAAGTLDLPAGELLIAGHALLAMRTFEFEFAHGFARLYAFPIPLQAAESSFSDPRRLALRRPGSSHFLLQPVDLGPQRLRDAMLGLIDLIE